MPFCYAESEPFGVHKYAVGFAFGIWGQFFTALFLLDKFNKKHFTFRKIYVKIYYIMI